MKDSLGDRIKGNYEDRTRYFLTRRTYTIIRIDGKAFHTYTKGLERPFDQGLVEDMDATAAYLCEKIMGAKLAFVQSDEITIVITDFEDIAKQAWFDNNLQKMCSISASMATSKFNQLRMKRAGSFDIKLAEFDSRVYQIPQKIEVINNLIWRQQDTVRNSISSAAQSVYSHKELNGKKTNEMQELLFQKGINWNDYDPKFKRGRLIKKETYQKGEATRSRWVSVAPPTFTQEPEYLQELIP